MNPATMRFQSTPAKPPELSMVTSYSPSFHRCLEERSVTFSPLAWLKLQLFLHGGDTEVGGFGICRENDLLYVEEFVSVKQRASVATVAFDDAAVADYFDDGGGSRAVSPQLCTDMDSHPSRHAAPSRATWMKRPLTPPLAAATGRSC